MENRFIIKKNSDSSQTQNLRNGSVRSQQQQQLLVPSLQSSLRQAPLSKAKLLVQQPQIQAQQQQQQQQQQRVIKQETQAYAPKLQKEMDISDHLKDFNDMKDDPYKEIRALKVQIQSRDQSILSKDFQLQSKEREIESAKILIVQKELEFKKLEADMKKLQREFQGLKVQLDKKNQEQQHEQISHQDNNTHYDQSEARSLVMALQLQERERRAQQAMQYFNFIQEAFQPQVNNDPNQIDTDNMTYEQLLELQEKIGHVSRGLTKEQIKKIKKTPITMLNKAKLPEVCSICYSEFRMGEKYRTLGCSHIYHGKCIKQWLNNEKKCPICKQEVCC